MDQEHKIGDLADQAHRVLGYTKSILFDLLLIVSWDSWPPVILSCIVIQMEAFSSLLFARLQYSVLLLFYSIPC